MAVYVKKPRPAPQPLTPEEREKLETLWRTHEEQLRTRVQHFPHGDELISELGEVLSRGEIFNRIAPEYTEDRFLRLALTSLKFIRMRFECDQKQRNRMFWRWLFRAVPKLLDPYIAEELAIKREAFSRLMEAVEELPERNRQALLGVLMDGRNHIENAEAYGWHERTQRRLFYASVESLRLAMLPQGIDPAFVVDGRGER